MGSIANLLALGYRLITEGDDYVTAEGSIANEQSDVEVDISALVAGNTVLIDNDETTAGRDLTVKFNDTGNNSRTVKATESLSIAIRCTKIYLSNSSGSTINYRILVIGV
jgi:hypothetical protein